MDNAVKITKWGNSLGIRIPASVLREAGLEMNDFVYVEADRAGRILINKKPAPKKGSLEYLFKDYSGERFDTELTDLGESVGEEKW
ncbi:MAG: AbrB/MazE/SpoVT family DNA-binding domain-containing protein [Clostridiales bacterium]|nr:AbrB/MazE/SpoVT family DNA-binding domain-containing protein [Clostridiales bacterium]